MRLNKFLSTAGVASRRKCDELIEQGKIFVDGKVAKVGDIVDEKTSKVEYNGQVVCLKNEFVYYKLNKPKGYICSANDEKGRKTIYSLLPNDKRLFSVGRLDYNTEGLLIVTNDGDFATKLSHPSFEIEKTYMVTIEGKIVESELAVLRNGVVEKGERLPKAKVKAIMFDGKTTKLSVVIHEGKNRQIRRMFEAIGKTIVLLKRVNVGPFVLGNINRGAYKEFSVDELGFVEEIKNTWCFLFFCLIVKL